MGMRALSAFFLLSLVLFGSITDGRKDPGDYWKSKMNGRPMPKAIADLIHQNTAADSKKSEGFARYFETKPNVIIYHSHRVHSEEPNSSAVDG